jgi:peptide/nickel transport system permease protein
MLRRIAHGARISLTVGLAVVAGASAMGVTLGMLSGYLGGKADTVIMRVMDVLLAFPGILLAIAIVAVRGPGLLNTMLAVAVVGIPGYARVMRSMVLSLREREYVVAARMVGTRDRRIMFRHIFPNSMSPLIVQATLGIGGAILFAAALGFLGLGAQPPLPEWGAMISDGIPFLRTDPHMVFFPGFAIMITVLGFNLLGDGLRDALDPQQTIK